MADEEPSLNIPSLLTLAVVSFFVIRWFLNRDSEPGAGGAGGSGRSRARGNAVDPAQVEQISQMFPQLNARDIMWDLQRNGGSVAATTERILSGGELEVVSSPSICWCFVYCLGRMELIVSCIAPAVIPASNPHLYCSTSHNDTIRINIWKCPEIGRTGPHFTL